MNGMVANEAHKFAGYKGVNSGQTERMPAVAQRLKWLQAQAADRVIDSNAVTRAEVITNAREILRLSMQGSAVTDKDGLPTGTYEKPDLSSANKANETMGKSIGLFVDVTRSESFDEELDGKGLDELKSLVLSLLEQLDPNMRKQLVQDIAEPAIDMEKIEAVSKLSNGKLLQ